MAYDLQLFTNNAVTLLNAPISASATSLTVMTGYGSLFPQPSGPNQYFLVTLEDQSGNTREIIRVNGRSGDTFTGLQRGQEGTTAVAWASSPGNDTLVDHRVTAETMRLAMLLPESVDTGIPGITIQEDGVTVGVAEDTQVLNFTGDVTVTQGPPGTKNIAVTGGSGSSDIIGETGSPITIDPGWTIAGSSSQYSNTNRGFKFFVTITMPANHYSTTFEVLGNISGNLNANTETVSFNRSARVGYNFNGVLNVVLYTGTKTIELTWTNNEINPVVIQCVRIQTSS